MNSGTPYLSYKIDAATNGAVPMSTFHLHSKHMDAGYGAAGLIFDSLFFSNGHSADIDVTIYVGRDS